MRASRGSSPGTSVRVSPRRAGRAVWSCCRSTPMDGHLRPHHRSPDPASARPAAGRGPQPSRCLGAGLGRGRAARQPVARSTDPAPWHPSRQGGGIDDGGTGRRVVAPRCPGDRHACPLRGTCARCIGPGGALAPGRARCGRRSRSTPWTRRWIGQSGTRASRTVRSSWRGRCTSWARFGVGWSTIRSCGIPCRERPCAATARDPRPRVRLGLAHVPDGDPERHPGFVQRRRAAAAGHRPGAHRGGPGAPDDPRGRRPA